MIAPSCKYKNIEIDISHCNFKKIPSISTTLTAKSSHWEIIGHNSIYAPSINSFVVYLKNGANNGGAAGIIDRYSGVLNWVAIEVL